MKSKVEEALKQKFTDEELKKLPLEEIEKLLETEIKK